jgi:NADH:ubiquinone oxidoreductase subunit K
MMTAVAAAIGGLGLACMLLRRSLLGVLVGVQLLALGSATMFVISGIVSGARVQGHVFALFIVLGGVAQLVGGYALTVRFFYLRNNIGMDELRSLKR